MGPGSRAAEALRVSVVQAGECTSREAIGVECEWGGRTLFKQFYVESLSTVPVTHTLIHMLCKSRLVSGLLKSKYQLGLILYG